MIKTNTELSKEAGKGKTNTKVAALGKAIAATPDSVTCSASEKSSLKEQVTLLDAIAAAIEAFVTELKEAIKVSVKQQCVFSLSPLAPERKVKRKTYFNVKLHLMIYLFHVQTATGSEPTDSELDNVATSTTKRVVLRRDKIVKDLLARM